MKDLIEQYLESKKNAWSPATLKSERARLMTLASVANLADPASTYSALVNAGYASYTIKQQMLRLSELERFALKSTLFSDYVENHARKFKNAYVPKRVPITFEEAHARISSITDGDIRNFCLGLLSSGLRISEPKTLTADGQVLGKGSKTRTAPNSSLVQKTSRASNAEIRSVLKEKTGLTPHQLRKLFATKAVQLGAREADLCAMMGWSSIATAASYVQATKTEEVTNKIGELFK